MKCIEILVYYRLKKHIYILKLIILKICNYKILISFSFCKGSKKLIAEVENFNTRNLYKLKLIILNFFKLSKQFFWFEKF